MVKLPGLTISLVFGGLYAVSIAVIEFWGARLPADWTNTTVASVTRRVTKSLTHLPTRLAHTIKGFVLVLVRVVGSIMRDVVSLDVLFDVVRLVDIVVSLFNELVAVYSSPFFSLLHTERSPFFGLSESEI